MIEGKHYFKTYAPTVRPETIRLIYALAAILNLRLYQCDVSTAFLNATMDTVVFAKIAPGMRSHDKFGPEIAKYASPVLRVLGALYGAKQAQRRWFGVFSRFLVDVIGCKRCIKDTCLFVLRNHLGFLVLALYVDDNLYGVKEVNGSLKKWFIDKMEARFKLSHEGLAEHFLGEDIHQDPDTFDVSVSHETYINSMLDDLNMQQAGTSVTTCPHRPNVRLQPEGELLENAKPYRKRIGMLTYLACRRFDVCQSVWQVSRFHKPTTDHWTAVTRVLRFLRGTKARATKYSKNNRTDLHAWVDADWAGDRTTYRSTSGRIVWKAGPLSWGAKLQSVVATSSAGAEYISASEGVKDIIYFRELLAEIGYPEESPSEVLIDNTAAVSMINKLNDHKRQRHILIRFHFTRTCCAQGLIRITWVPSAEQLADIFTKPVAEYIYHRICKVLYSE